MASNDRKVLSVRFVAEGIETVQRQIEGLGKAGSDAAAKINAAFAKSSLGAEIQKRLNAIRQGFAATVAAGQRFASSFQNVGQRLKDFNAAIAGSIGRILRMKAALGLASAAVVALFKSFGNNAETITQNAAALGMTTDEYQRFAAAARDVGIEQTKLDTIIAKFNIGVEEAGDEAEKAAKKTDKLGKSLEQVVVKGADGKDKIVTIRRGIQDLKDEVGKFEGVTKTGTEGLLQYAKSLEAAGGPTERLAKAAKDFGTKQALAAVKFFSNLTFQFDDAARAAAGLIQPLTDLELLIGNNLDQSFDNLTTNLSLIKDRLLAVFSPSITKVVEYFTRLIQQNEQTLLEWAREIDTYVSQVVDDLINIIGGNPDAAENKWLIPLVEGVRDFGEAVRYVFTEVVPAAFRTLRGYAEQAAQTINSIFGTDFTGDSLLVAIAIGYVTGALDIFIKGAILAGSVIYTLALGFRVLSTSVTLVLTALRPLLFLIGYVGAAVAALIGAPAWVGIAIVAAIAAAGALIYAYWDEIVAYAEASWEWIKQTASDALDGIVSLFGRLSTEWTAIWDRIAAGDWQGALDEVSAQSAAWWEQFIADTMREVELINEGLKAIGIDLPAVWDHIANGAMGVWDDIVAGASALGNRLAPYWDTLKEQSTALWEGVQSTAKSVWDGVAGIISGAATKIGEAVSAVWNAASEAISGATSGVAETASNILTSITDALTAAQDVQGALDLAASLVAPFTDAKARIEEIWNALPAILAAKGGEIGEAVGTALADIESLPTRISEAVSTIPQSLAQAGETALAGFRDLTASIVSEVQSMAAGVNEALSGLSLNVNLNGIVSSFRIAAQNIVTAWSAAMNSVVRSTGSMVDSVQSLISRLVSYLERLRAAIARAQSQARGSGGSGDGRAGRAVGGYVSGPGTGISDSIQAWLSNGEFVIKARAVKHWGLDVLYAMNNMQVPRFAAGGLVGAMAGAVTPRNFARPLDGASARLSPYTLVFEGQEYPGFKGPAPDALRQIGKSRVISRIASNNRSPKWRG